MRFKPYPNYKPSGVEWLGDVPVNWAIKKFKQVFQERQERSVTGEETLLSVSAYTGVTPRGEIIEEGEHLSRSESLVDYKICHPNDLVMNIMLAWNRGLGITKHHGIVSPAYCVFTIQDASNPKFLDYLLRSDEYITYFKAFSSGVIDSRLRLYPDVFRSLSTALPSIEEQSAIAAFLDRETAKIDTLVAKQKKLIELLKEKRQAIIFHAVTKGLNPNAKMKDSGIEWLGKVPQDWVVTPLRALSQVVRGASPRPAGEPKYFGGDHTPWVTVAEVTNGDSPYLTETAQYLTEEGANNSRLFPRGTLLFSNSGATLGVPKILKIDACANDGVVGFLSLSIAVTIKFLYFFLCSLTDTLRDEVKQGAGQPNLNTSIVKSIRIPLPSVDEQIAIVSYLESQLRKIDALISKAEQAITLQQEHRAALISAAVTGKIDVRSYAAELEAA